MEDTLMKIQGYARYRGGASAMGLKVKLFDEDLSESHELETSATDKYTDEYGKFSFEYSLDRIGDHKQLPDLKVKCYDPNTDKLVGESDIIYGATNDERIKIIIDGGIEYIWSEFAQIHSELYPLLKDGTSFSDIKEDKDIKQLSYLTGHTKIPRSKVRAFIQSYILEAATESIFGGRFIIFAAFFYGLLRSGQPKTLMAILMLSSDSVKQSTHEAIRNLWIPWDIVYQIESILEKLNRIRVEFILGSFEKLEQSLLDKIIMLEISNKTLRRIFYLEFFRAMYGDQTQLEFESLERKGENYADYDYYLKKDQEKLEQFWDSIAGHAQLHQYVEKLKSTLRIAIVVGGEFETIKLLRNERDNANLEDFSFLVLKELADWKLLVGKLDDEKTEVDLSPPRENETYTLTRRELYAKTLYKAVEEAFPNLLIIERLIKHLHPGNDALYKFLSEHKANKEELLVFINEEGEETKSLRSQIENTQTILNHLPNKDYIIVHLNTCQRLYRLTLNFDSYLILNERGISSALDIIKTNRDRFILDYNPLLEKHISVQELYMRAHEVSSIILTAYNMLAPVYNDFKFNKVSEGITKGEFRGDPDWNNLFNSADIRYCEHWASVLSPSAYLVELLNFLRDRKDINDVSLYEKILERRPDLTDIQFSKENTLTKISYIDIVLEILERLNSPFEFELQTDLSALNIQDGDLVSANPADKTKNDFYNIGNIVLSENASYETVGDDNNKWYISDKGVLYRVETYNDNKKQKVIGKTYQSEKNYESISSLGNFSQEAYENLVTAKRPWNLPFDLSREITRSYLNSFISVLDDSITDVPVSEEMKNLGEPVLVTIEKTISINPGLLLLEGNSDSLQVKSIISELLNLASVEELEQLLHPVINNHYDPTKPINNSTSNKKVSFILKCSGISESDFQEYMLTRFVSNKGVVVFDEAYNSDKSFKEWRINQFTANDARRLFTFAKIRNRTKWPVSETDHAIKVVANGCDTSLTNFQYQKLGYLAYLSRLMKLSVNDIACLFDEIPKDTYQAYFYELFPKTIVQNTPLELKNGKVDEGKKLSEVISLLQGAFKVSGRDLDKLLKHIGENTQLTVKNISSLYQYIVIHKAFNSIKVHEIYELIDLFDLDPFRFTKVKDCITLIEILTTITNLDIDVNELLFLFKENLDTNTKIVNDSSIISFLKTIKLAIKEIHALTKLQDDETGEFLRQMLSQFGFDDVESNALFMLLSGNKEFFAPLETEYSKPPFTYNAESKTLHFIGFMDENLKLNLKGVSDDNADKAIEIIFKKQTDIIDGFKRKLNEFEEINVDERTKLETIYNISDTESRSFLNRSKILLDLLLPRLNLKLINGILQDSIVNEFEIKSELWSDSSNKIFFNSITQTFKDDSFLNFTDNSDLNNLGDITSQKQAYINLKKIAILIEQFKLELNGQKYLLTNDGKNKLLEYLIINNDLNNSKKEWLYFSRFILTLKKDYRLFNSREDIYEILNKTNLADIDDLVTNIAGLLEEDLYELDNICKDLKTIDGSLIKDSLFHTFSLSRLFDTIVLLNKLQTGYKEIQCFNEQFLNNNFTYASSLNAMELLRARFGDNWSNSIKPINDSIKEKRRDALRAILYEKDPDLNDENDFDEKYLIGVQMSPCMDTSRIVQAYISVQRFINRCMEGREKDIIVDPEQDPGWNDWVFLQQYRIWEAKRKIYLFAEVWLDPSLRDDKSQIYTNLENRLLQNPITEENALKIYEECMEKMLEISKLEVVGFYKSDSNSELYVFGRTRGIPEVYYHRKLIENIRWTPWEHIELDLTGDHFVPVFWNNRLYLIWPVFQEINISEDQETADMRWQIQLAWSVCRDGKWSPKKITKGKVLSYYGPSKSDETDKNKALHMFRSEIYKDELVIHWAAFDRGRAIRSTYDDEYWWQKPEIKKSGSFHFTGIGNQWYVTSESKITLRTITGYIQYGNWFVSNNVNVVFLPTQLNPQSDGIVLKKVDPRISYRIVPDYQNLSFSSNKPFFFEDGNRSYFIKPVAKRKRFGYRYDRLNRAVDIRAIDSVRFNAFSNIYSDNLIKLEETSDLVDIAKHEASNLPQDVGNFGANSDLAFLKVDKLIELGVRLPFETGKGLSKSFDYELKIAQKSYIFPHTQESIKYGFYQFDMPFTKDLFISLNKNKIKGLLKTSNQELTLGDNYFAKEYQPSFKNVLTPYPLGQIDFSYSGSHSIYNWEWAFLVPFQVALQLSANRMFKEARNWFHYIFNPTKRLNNEETHQYWITKPLKDAGNKELQKNILKQLIKQIISGEQNEELAFKLNDWRQQPFNPHAIARLRITVYQKAVVMKYLDNLIAWADDLFRRDQREEIEQASSLYNEANDILGTRPVKLNRFQQKSETYLTYDKKLKKSAFLKEIEQLIGVTDNERGLNIPDEDQDILSSSMFYFFDVENEYLIKYWDIIADRLYKINHCQNIDGQVRSLSLFAPPIDPGMLVYAAAFGLDIGTILAQQYKPRPLYRFESIIQFARQLCNNLIDLGSELQAIIEKKEAEELANLTKRHQLIMQKSMKDIKEIQIKENVESLNGLRESWNMAKFRFNYYNKLYDKGLIDKEKRHLDHLDTAQDWMQAANVGQMLPSVLHLAPQIIAGLCPSTETGGNHLGSAAEVANALLRMKSSHESHLANTYSIKSGHDRRDQDWKFQYELAEKELKQIEKQLAAAELRLSLSHRDLEIHNEQTSQSEVEYDYMKSKFSNEKLYTWMLGKISSLYYKAYQLAFDVAKEAESACKYDLGDWNMSSIINYNTWSSQFKGLTSGKELRTQLDTLESYYKRNFKRRDEFPNKKIELSKINPLALIQLRQTGECYFEFSEELFDADHFGQYDRRIKSVNITIPCVKSATANVNAKLILLNDSIRRNDDLLDGNQYLRRYSDNDQDKDNRFIDNLGKIEHIRTSSAVNDSGQFEVNFRDERYLKFEGAGVISKWKLELPYETNHFDFNTITDIYINISYSAKEGKQEFAQEAKKHLKETLKGEHSRIISLKHEMPETWDSLIENQGTKEHDIKLSLDKEILKSYNQFDLNKIQSIEVFTPNTENWDDYKFYFGPDLTNENKFELTEQPSDTRFTGLFYGKSREALNENIGEWTFRIKPKSDAPTTIDLQNIIIIINYNLKES